MLNEDIKIDLHIHSYASKYKEDEQIVAESTKDNLDVLISKLEENEIGLCAITDHNRFDYDLYDALRKKINETESVLKCNLPGVEFDVMIDANKPRCHIVTIFDDSDDEKLRNLERKIFDVKELNNPEESYTLKNFEDILKNIGLKTILIVHQKQSLDNHNGRTASLSDSTDDPYKIIQAGFIDALEYNSPRVEGIVKASLRSVDKIRGTALFTGSDCHTWSCYPCHDASCNNSDITFTKLRCLPTFKGLLMAVTSFKTRANRRSNQNKRFIKNIKINGKEYTLSRGINAIIGDNGSGKSMLLELMNGEIAKPYYRKLIECNNIEIEEENHNSMSPSREVVMQGSITDKVKKGELFEDKVGQYYKKIKTRDDFANVINRYFDEICLYVDNEIMKQETLSNLEDEKLEIRPHNYDFYYPRIDDSLSLEEDNNDARLHKFAKIISDLEYEIRTNEDFYSNYKNLQDAVKILKDIESKLVYDVSAEKQINMVKSIIVNKLDDLENIFEGKRNSKETDLDRIDNEYRMFKDKIIQCIKVQQKKIAFPDFPKKMIGISTNNFKGYIFTKTAKYHNEDLEQPFYEHCFNKGYQDKSKIKDIKTREDFSKALSNHDCDDIEGFKSSRVGKFIEKYQEESSTIAEASSHADIGNTPGEIALVYYKFMIRREEDYDLLLIDQPEDDINPQRIKKILNSFIDSIRCDKQIILVTHSPLLVVNLDVDNVICLSKNNDLISIRSGCLEYEDNEYSVLKLVENNLDGGYDAIERRIKAYGKDIN